MERDFMGLNSKESLAAVKEEVSNDGLKDPSAGFSNLSEVQWPFKNRVSALPHFMSFKGAHEDRTRRPRTVTEPIMSTGFMPISTPDAFDSTKKHAMGEMQKSFNQGGTHFSMTPYPVQVHDVHFVQRSHDMKMFPVSNQQVSVSMANPFFKNHFVTTGATVKQQLIGGVPVTAPHPVLPTTGSIAGITEQQNSGKGSTAPAQLTIFYGGEVNVYDNISPEKAQAIMLLAGSAPSISSKSMCPNAEVLAPTSKSLASDSSPVNQSFNTPPCSGLASPLSVSSHTGAQSGSRSTCTDEQIVAKSVGVSNAEPPKVVNMMGSITATTMVPSAVPQARKASLARFLEKRKTRLVTVQR